MKNISEQIYLYRTKCGLSQMELAEKLDVSRQSISKWETGIAFPELPKLIKLCEIFGVSLDEFVSDEKPKTEEKPEKEIQYVYLRQESKSIIKPILGGIFLIPAILMFFLTDFISAVLFAVPCIVSAIVCFRKTNHTALWCVWVWFFYIEIYLYLSASVKWGISFNAYYWQNAPLQAIISILLMLILTSLIAVTVRAYRTHEFQFSPKKNISLAIGALGTFVLRPFALLGWRALAKILFAREPIGEPTKIEGSLYYLYEMIPSSQFYLVELIEILLDTVFVIGFTACLVPTFYCLLHIIRRKKQLQ